MRNPFFKKILFIIAVFFAAIMQQIALPAMGIFFLGQWPVFALVFLAGFFEKGVFPLVVAVMAGALIDLISGGYFGIFTLSLFFVVLITKMAQQRLKLSNPFAIVFAFVFCALCFLGISRLLFYVFTI